MVASEQKCWFKRCRRQKYVIIWHKGSRVHVCRKHAQELADPSKEERG